MKKLLIMIVGACAMVAMAGFSESVENAVVSVKEKRGIVTVIFQAEEGAKITLNRDGNKEVAAKSSLFKGEGEKVAQLKIVNQRVRLFPNSHRATSFLETDRFKKIKFRSNRKITEENGAYTIADYKMKDGTTGTIQVKVN